MNVAVATFDLQYGDPFDGTKVHPFSSFTFSTELASGPSTTVTELGTRGMLAALGRREGPTRHVSGVFMDFEYQWNEAYQFSQQSFGLGLLSRTGSSAWRLNTDISAELLPLVASSDPYAEETVSRMYDYGAGVGGRAFAQLEYRGFRVLSAGYRGFWTATVNGASHVEADPVRHHRGARAAALRPVGGRLLQHVPAAQHVRRALRGSRCPCHR